MMSSDSSIHFTTTLAIGVISGLLVAVQPVKGHGRLIDPPARSSMWRYGFNTPVNYDDNALYCGGFDHQWNRNGGRCGVCGDPFDGSRDHEAGGRYARGVIAKTYRQGQMIRVSVELTKSHLGWFEFRLCSNNNPRRRVTKACLDANLLRLRDGSTRYHVRSWDSKVHHITLRLPPHTVCSQCVLQWKYNAGNSWGCNGRNTGCCSGCGHQEQFYGCADVAIGRSLSSSQTGNYQNVVGINNHNNNNNNQVISNAGRYRPINSNLINSGSSGNSGTNIFSSNGGSNLNSNQGLLNFIRG